jgi:serine/threonine-protein kinase HipA
MRRLNAWLEGEHVGVFTQGGDGHVGFEYAAQAPPVPVSLSLPRDGGWAKQAPARFLDNLLPDNDRTRRRMAQDAGAASDNVFDLLEKVGGDVAGGLVLAEGDDPPDGPAGAALVPLGEDDIAFRVRELLRDPDLWLDRDLPAARFSLAGTQAKFTLAKVDGRWFAPNGAVPSTHIVKPAAPNAPGADWVEAATMGLARACGVPAPGSELLTVLDQQAFMVERFDRDLSASPARRLHTEDLAQAMGLDRSKKYGPTAAQVVGLLRRADPSLETAYAFVQLLAFNVAAGNADAHAKNYSVFLRPRGIGLTPLYDALTTTYWPHVDGRLAMGIGGAARSAEVTPAHWAKLARRAGLDPDRVVDLASDVATRVVANAAQAHAWLPAEMRQRLVAKVVWSNTGMVKGWTS